MFAEVVFPLPFRNRFTYSIPEDLRRFAAVGVRSVVPFGKRKLTGYIVNITDKPAITDDIKPLEDILDDIPVFDKSMLEFYEWIADYYLSSPGDAIKLAMPYGADVETKRKVIIDPERCKELLLSEKKKNTIKRKILEVIAGRVEINFGHLQKMSGKKNIYSAVRSLEEAGALTVISELSEAKVKAKKINFIRLTRSPAELYTLIPEIERRSPKQVKLLLDMLSLKGKEAPLSEALKRSEVSKASADSLAAKGFVEIYEKEVDRVYEELYSETQAEFKLTEAQEKVIHEVSAEIDENKFKAYLLHGVTGSGKTQVYIELVKNTLAKNKAAIILVPEISLTPQITSRFTNNFGDKVTVIHSRMSPGERYDSWRRVLKGKAKVVIGARSALFAPLKDTGLIVVDEEHDASYKQFDSAPKYNARDCAVILAKFSNCPVVLGSATPSVESMWNAETGKYALLSLPERVDNAKMPGITLVNIADEKKKRKMENVFSSLLIEKIKERLEKKEGVIILQNRRGFSTQMYCEDCGELEVCDNCSVSMVYHINQNTINCHYCGLVKKVPPACTNCGSLNLKFFGAGTERVEDELEYHFPNSAIRRIDSDSISRKNTLSQILFEFSKGDIDILVGTQMVSKGLDFPRVTLVGVISAEATLWLPDFRSDERTFQLLTQVAGRAGRSKAEGEVIIQTQNDKHFTLLKVLANDYRGFYEREISDRKRHLYPPFSKLCLIEAKDQTAEKARGAINDFYKELRKYRNKLIISTPASAIIARLKSFYRFQIMVKAKKDVDPSGAIMRKAVLDSFVEFNRRSRYRDVKLFYDVDPQSVI